jgi:hypothetical protein
MLPIHEEGERQFVRLMSGSVANQIDQSGRSEERPRKLVQLRHGSNILQPIRLAPTDAYRHRLRSFRIERLPGNVPPIASVNRSKRGE